MNVRAAAVKVLMAIHYEGITLSVAISKQLTAIKLSEKPLLQELSYGTCRYYYQLIGMVDGFLWKPVTKKQLSIYYLLLVGAYQLQYMQVSEKKAVMETVNAVKDLKEPWANGLVNAVLRNMLRQPERISNMLEKNEETRYAHPQWMIECFKKAWPEQWKAILLANNQRPPLALRVNGMQVTREHFLQCLQEREIVGTPIPHTEHGVVLEKPCAIETLPGFKEGWFSVQDGASQCVAPLLTVEKPQRILDACAAPGGKVTHLLELMPDALLVALDPDGLRLKKMKDNMDRLQLQATVKKTDATQIKRWWDGEPFDAILCDAPCSGTGVIRRHPDIKSLRTKDDLIQLTRQQMQLLEALWPVLKPGGILLYSTCSILPEENHELVAAFLKKHQDAEVIPLNVPWGHSVAVGQGRLPGEEGMDGFYYAKLKKDVS